MKCDLGYDPTRDNQPRVFRPWVFAVKAYLIYASVVIMIAIIW